MEYQAALIFAITLSPPSKRGSYSLTRSSAASSLLLHKLPQIRINVTFLQGRPDNFIHLQANTRPCAPRKTTDFNIYNILPEGKDCETKQNKNKKQIRGSERHIFHITPQARRNGPTNFLQRIKTKLCESAKNDEKSVMQSYYFLVLPYPPTE